MLRLLTTHADHIVLTQFQKNPRAVPAHDLAALLSGLGPKSMEIAPTPAAALDAARRWAGPGDLIAITGSIFLAGELRPLLAGPSPETPPTPDL